MVPRNAPLHVRRGLLALAFIAAAGPAAATETVSVILDQAQVMRLPDKVATIVIGNPLIADATVQAGGLLVLTGKGYGTTNLLALDRTGAVLMERAITVEGPRDHLVVYRGVERESYSCSPECERRITLGDSQPYFDATLAQTGNRSGQAQGGGPAGTGAAAAAAGAPAAK